MSTMYFWRIVDTKKDDTGLGWNMVTKEGYERLKDCKFFGAGVAPNMEFQGMEVEVGSIIRYEV